jgi:uncharacterized protein YbjT (DUF2867 family)
VTVLVTGASGFVGGHVVARLRADGRDVRAFVRDPASARDLDAELVQGDMTDPQSVRRAVAGCETVIHLVGILHGRPEQFRRVMIEGTRSLIAAAKEANVRRVVLMSALGATAETKDLVPYYNAKWTQDQDLKASGLEHVIFRPSFVFARDGGILPTFATLARFAPVTPIVGSGRQRIQPIHADDVAAYFSAAVDLPAAANRLFELGGPDAVSWNELWTRLKRALGVRRPSVHVPMALARLNAMLTERLPGEIPLTRDLLKMLEAGDNVVTDTSAVQVFGLPLLPLDEQLRRSA